ncbi:MAG: carbonic anhydrase, partial [Nitrosopumilaceae archaeon]
HGSSLIAIAGHHDCAGNPVSKQEHIELIKKSIDTVKSWNYPTKIVGIWVNEKWQVEHVNSTKIFSSE